MISVKVRQNSIEVSGHAGAAPRGQSVPCAGVSAMTWMLGKGPQGNRRFAWIRFYEGRKMEYDKTNGP